MSHSNAATREQLWDLWRLLLDALLDYFECTPPQAMRASMLDVAARFLRDNNISYGAGGIHDLRESLQQLADISVPFSGNKEPSE